MAFQTFRVPKVVFVPIESWVDIQIEIQIDTVVLDLNVIHIAHNRSRVVVVIVVVVIVILIVVVVIVNILGVRADVSEEVGGVVGAQTVVPTS